MAVCVIAVLFALTMFTGVVSDDWPSTDDRDAAYRGHQQQQQQQTGSELGEGQ